MARRYLDISDLPPSEPPRPHRGSPQSQAAAAARRGSGSPAASSHRSADKRSRGRGHTSGSYSITSTPEAHSADIGRRMVIYSIQMLLRVICLIAFVLVDNWVLRIVCAAGVVILPWSAVLLANVGADRTERSSEYAGPPHPRAGELAEGRAHGPQQTNEVFEGEYVDEQGQPLTRQLGGRPAPAAHAPPGTREEPMNATPRRMRDNGDDDIVIDGQVREDPPSIAP